MKKFINLCIAAVLAFSLPVGVTAADTKVSQALEDTAAGNSAGLPAVGETVEGFTVKERGTYSLTGSDTVLFEHEKTGAEVFYIASDAIDRSFTVAVKTPAMDNKGIPHVFEHATISGSGKYPSHNLIYTMMYSTYNTSINAYTRPNMTIYPMSSLSEEQLLTDADFYLSGLLYPSILEEERIYRREAWRYELPDADSPITVNGTVYNEMKGTNTISLVSGGNAIDALFPDSIIGNNPGGVPEDIATMTWDDLRDFHSAYYHPSNMLVTMFGDLDYTKFLRLMDKEYFSKFDKKVITVETGEINPITEPIEKVYPFPMEANAISDNAAVFSYGFAANGADYNEQTAVELIAKYLTQESSPLVKNLREALPGADLSYVVNPFFNSMFYPVPFNIFTGTGLNEDDKEVFKKVIGESLEQVSEDGIDKEIFKSLLDSDKIVFLTLSEQGNFGVNLGIMESANWASNGSVGVVNVALEAYDYIDANLNGNYLDELFKKYFIDNQHQALAITVPKPGLAEENAAAFAEELAKMKASMSDDEIAALVKETVDMNEWTVEEPSAELVSNVQAVTVDNLPEEIRIYEINESEKNGVRYMTAEADVAGIGRTLIKLDTSAVPIEELHYLKLYGALVGNLPTKMYTLDEAELLKTKYLNNFSGTPGFIELYNSEEFTPTMTVEWTTVNKNYKASAALINEFMFNMDFTDIEAVKTVVERLKTGMRNSFTGTNGVNLQSDRAMAASVDIMAYSNYLNGIEYYQFLIDASKALEENPEKFCQKLSEITAKFTVRDNVNVLYAGDADGIKQFNDNIESALEGLTEGTITPTDYIPELYTHSSEAIIVNSAVQSNIITASFKDMGLKYNAKYAPLQLLLTDKYMLPTVRHGLGSYGAGVYFTSTRGEAVHFYSVSDPNVEETFDAYEGLAAFVEDMEITQQELDNYILTAYSGFSAPVGELTGAVNAMNDKLAGIPDDILLQELREIKSFTVKDVKEAAEIIRKAAEIGFRSTLGGATAIEEHAGLFEEFVDINAMNPDIAAKGGML